MNRYADPAPTLMKRSISIVVPVRNEAKEIEELSLACREAILPLGLAWELLFIDDGSEDETLSQIENVARTVEEIRLLRTHGEGQSKATAVGVRRARHGSILTIDADQRLSPDVVRTLLASLTHEGDLILGNRGTRSSLPRWRRGGSALLRSLLNGWLGASLSDATTSIRLFSQRLGQEAVAFAERCDIPLHLALLDRAERIVEVPFPYRVRPDSRYHLWTLARLAFHLLRAFPRLRRGRRGP
ncbi:MAG: glycosyltransferase family 2 protein [Deltaproteobacteria bacterium]|nr:MAG: glycosyltransferase family 2 protein [Deltaproteobacteria bacterium]